METLNSSLTSSDLTAISNMETLTSARQEKQVTNYIATSRVSVIIPAYNSAKFLPEAIESVLSQTYPVFEIIVVDDGSTDNTKEICDRYPTVQYVYQNNQGASVARNTGVRVSQGEYLLFLDSDDCLLPKAVEIGVNCINDHPEVGFVFGSYSFKSINPDGSYTTEEIYDNQPEIASYATILAAKHKIQCACIIFRREAVESVGGFDPNLRTMQDINLFLRVAREFPIHYHHQLVSEYRYTGSNVSRKPAKMLIDAMHSHSLQWSYIQQTGNKEYAAAYECGKQAWIKLFGERLPYEIIRYVEAGQWVEALGHLRLIVNYDPKLKCLNKDIYESSYKALLSRLRELPIESSLAYWQQQLAGVPPLLSLPTDRPRLAEQTFAGNSQSFALSQELTAALSLLSKQEEVTLFMTLLTAFDTLLYRYTGTEDIIVGSPIASSDRSFVNAVALRTDISGNPSFQQLLERVREVALGAYTHQDLPFEILVETLQPQRDLSYSPLFQVMLVFEEDVSLQKVELSSLTASPWVIENKTAKFDLTLFLEQTSNGLIGKWEYNTDLFDRETIERMSGHFQSLLEGIVAHPEQPISELPLLTAPEKQQLLVGWNQTDTEYPQDRCLHQLFEEQVERTPDAVAVVFEQQQLTYKELNSRANQLAHYLRTLGVEPDVPVGICVERSLEMVVGLLGILKAGGAYVPLDPAYPPERLTYMLSDSQMPVLVTQQDLVSLLPKHHAKVVCLDTDWNNISEENDENSLGGVTVENLAYIIYTSGSTGKPKGVQIIHGGVTNFLNTMRIKPGLTEQDILLAITTISFDIAVLELYLPLIFGAKVVLVSREVAVDGMRLLKLLNESNATVMQATPATWHLLLAAGWKSQSQLKILCGGEALSQELASQLLARVSSVWNMYGPTEATVWATTYEVGVQQSLVDTQKPAMSIGKPIGNTQIYILDRHLQPVPIGISGELYIGGVCLARGYLNRPDLTTEKFITNPFSHQPSSRLYKTGDLARYLPNGDIEYLTRIDNQVKIRGFRIELGEIEILLAKHPDIREVAVIVREDIPGDKRLVAYIVHVWNQTPSVADLLNFLSQKLPKFMIPSAFVIVDALPLTPNGKVDRRALLGYSLPSDRISLDTTPKASKVNTSLLPNTYRISVDTGFVAPTSPTEEILAGIWSQALGLDQISIHDNFFLLGGHSLLATKVILSCYQAFSKQLSLRDLFESPTIATLSVVIDKSPNKESELPEYQIIPQRANQDSAPLSFSQERLWFLQQLEPDRSDYHFCLAVRLKGHLNLTALQQALDAVVAHHEVLRTNFINEEGNPIQVIRPPHPVKLLVVDLQEYLQPQRLTEVERLLQQESQRIFDLSQDLMLRGCLLQIAPDEQILLLAMHHIAIDGGSTAILSKELSELYKAFSSGQPSLLPELHIQYADYAVWQRQWLQGEVLESLVSYWKQKLANAPDLLSLPTDRPRSPVQTFRGSTQSFALSPQLTTALRSLSSQTGVTLFMTLLAAFDTLLYRYTGTEDILVGSPIANRNHQEIAGLIGFFVNNLVLRVDMSGNPSFRELLGQVREVALEAYAHQDLPFQKLVEELQPQRDLSYSPLFQVMFVFNEDVSLRNMELSGLTLSPWAVENKTAQFDLTLYLRPSSEEGLVGGWEYNTDLFDSATISRMAANFEILLESIVANPEQPISELSLLTAQERQQLLFGWNQTLIEYPHDRCIHQLFEEQVARNPEAVAVVFAGEHLTYRELNSRANQLAHYLQSLGVSSDVLVGICLERSLEMAVAFLGIFKAGGAYVPLDPSYPSERLAFMLEDAQTPVILTQERLLAVIPDRSAKVVCLDTNWQEIAQHSPENPVLDINSRHLAYVIYTSGSTGKPKGVMITHQGLVNHNLAIAKLFALEPSDRMLQFASISFDIAVEELFPTWISGATVVLRDEEMLSSISSFLQFIEREQITILDLPTAFWHQMVMEMQLLEKSFPKSMRLVVVGGEKASRETYANWLNLVGNSCRWINTYGPTETTVVATCYEPTANLETESSISEIPIGRPIANTQIYILDQQLQPVPIGVPGELYIGGAGLARGYLNRLELTASKFIPNPLIDDPNAYLYKTGDLARYRRDGNIEFLGRIDNQTKIRGFRIELAEIEASVSQNPKIKDSLIIVREEVPGDKHLVAYVVPFPEQVVTDHELRSFLKTKLPNYMIPSQFLVLEALPMTPNGKLNRRGLPKPAKTRLIEENNFIAPRTPTEEILAHIWSQVLGWNRVSINDNFFDLGGHSLLVIQALAHCHTAFSVELSLRQFFATPTVADLAAAIDQAQQQNSGMSNYQIVPQRVNRESAPLSFAQQRLWFLEQLDPNRSDYHISQAIKLTGSLNIPALQQALDGIVTHHEVLRTNFINEQGNPLQVIGNPRHVELVVVDLQDCPQPQQEQEIQRLLEQESDRPFNFSEDLMLRGRLLQVAPQENILVLVIHHIAADAWSMNIFLPQLKQLYEAFCQGQSCSLPELPIQYADFAAWQRQYLQNEYLESLLDYWKQQLAGAPELLLLPTDRPRPAVQKFQGAKRSFRLSRQVMEALSLLSKQEKVTIFMTLVAAFNTLLYRYTGSEDILVGSPIANRNRPEIQGLIGFFVNTLVFRTDMSGNPSFQELLERVREVALGAYTHQDLPFESLVEALQPKRDLSYSPLFQVMLVFEEDVSQQKFELPGLTVSPWNLENKTAKFDLTLFLEQTNNGLIGKWEYNTDLFDSETIERMSGHFQSLLEGIVAHPEQPISELPLLTAPEKQQLLVEWNQTDAEYPQDKCIHQLFEEQVKRTPDAVAVVFEQQQLTYRELNTRANQLAHYLRTLGVEPDVPVGICVERSLEMVVGLLGILKAGGAYVPLDPAYPQDRLSFMLENSQASVLLTSQNLVGELPEYDGKVLYLDADWDVIAQENQENLVSGVKPENLGYVIYTSGSTGMPKGVAMKQLALCNLIFWQQQNTTVSGLAKTLQFTPISFDVSFQEIFSTWCSGGTLVLIGEELRRDTLALLDLLQEQAVERLFLPFVALQQLAEVAVSAELFPDNLREIITAGEQLQITPAIYNFVTHLNNCTLHNHYGPSESHVVTAFTLANSAKNWAALPPIGKPIANTQIYILDSHMQPVPIGVSGELYIGGYCLARGYLNRPDLTAARFISDPFSNDPNARLYKTGDLCRYLSDGNIEYLGRIDNQVKVRGFRIELGEIEALLSRHSAIAQTTLIVREDIPGDKRLVAYIVPNQEPAPTSSELRHFLQQKLPDYMLPSAFVMLESLPLTPSGKVDRRALPALEHIRQGSEATFVAPREELEVRLTKIWEQVLNVRPIGIKDNFFELGGHSLLAVRLFAEIEQICGKKLPLATLFQAQTIEDLAGVLRQSGWSAPWSSLVLIKPGGQKPPLFCVHPVGGNILEYQALANYLDREQPVYGIQALGLDGKQSPLLRIEDMANHYIQEIRSIQPNGPYFLAGYSFGGLVAFEMAQQLYAQGQNVALLALFDRNAPNFVSIRPSFVESIRIHLNNFRQLERKKKWNYLRDRILYRSGQLTYKQALMRGLSELETLTPQYLKVIDCNEQATKDYKPLKVYPVKVSLFRCQVQRPKEALSADFGWGDLVAGNVEIHHVPGEHYGMLREPGVRVLAEILQRCLERSQTDVSL
ncbi:non-ribosomal peptide synthetase [Merismopedia glauca]|uniref:Non-ribosomal peptide synthetase n=1 Tax=Merismopedia glauca CCAP 1448/3 TaxID=1296344 RepID=A0A2T1C1N8_9CYAN|nr:non-ribosomal peptide synthetase [Merismopedia glauca]PSB02088.1 non-ribosomal peptide synthetase [Merismopedia glauca CCAP 1448/3]